MTSEASKRPQKYFLMSYSKAVTSITYVTKFQGIFISQKMTSHEGGDDKQGPLTCVAIAAGNKI